MELDKKLIGHTFKPFTATVEAGKIKLSCKAVGEEDPIYTDAAAAKAAGYRGITAPLTFLRALQADDPNKGGLLKLLNVDIYDKKGGALWFVVQEMEMKDQTGKLVAKGRGVTVVRNPDAAKK